MKETNFYETGTNEGFLVAVDNGRTMPHSAAVAAKIRAVDSNGKTLEIEVEDVYALAKFLTRLAVKRVKDYAKDGHHQEDAHTWTARNGLLRVPPAARKYVTEQAEAWTVRQRRIQGGGA
jgi:hypothetical protein